MLVLGWLVCLFVAKGHCLMVSMQPNGSFPVIPSYARLLLLLMLVFLLLMVIKWCCASMQWRGVPTHIYNEYGLFGQNQMDKQQLLETVASHIKCQKTSPDSLIQVQERVPAA